MSIYINNKKERKKERKEKSIFVLTNNELIKN
jgi:hypothetical protein